MSAADLRGFLGITELVVRRSCVEETYAFLRKAGRKGFEGLVLWPGRREGTRLAVENALVPKQTVYRSESGLGYFVEEEELAKIADYLADNGLVLPAQVHSHPTEAYHSEADDADPIVATLGGFSLVVPDFAAGPPSLSSWAVYRLAADRGWTRLSPAEINTLVTIS